MIRSRRIKIAHLTLAVFAVAILCKAASVQLVHGKDWRGRAERQQSSDRLVPAPRGEIFDETHRLLAESREMVRLEIAPREVTEPAKLRRALARLGIDRPLIARALNPSGKYLTIPGRFLAVDAADAIGLHGVHSYATIMRSYAVSRGAQAVVGHVDADDKPVDGIEFALDSILRGKPGTATMFRDSRGQSRESPTAPGTAPTAGNNVILTINADLQEIAEKALADAVARMGAEGGDIVILDPHTGEVLAMASRRLDPRATSAAALTEPFEPGSTMKPFIAAGLLDRGLAHTTDTVDTGKGEFDINGRVIHDEHLIGRAALPDVLRWSSNIGIVKFALRFSPRQEFETLRDFGFGMPTGVEYPTESNGILRPPKSWSVQSPNSMAMGYEVSVTPLQLAAAYATFANDGQLLEPALIKEIDAPDGSVRYRHTPHVVRQVVSKAVANTVLHMLLNVVDEGTALQAAIDDYSMAGKTGSPRATLHGRYVAGRNDPNFVGLFPGDAPQYVIVVKLDAPQSSTFAAATAAPVSKVILEAAIAARDAALDRAKLAKSVIPSPKDSTRAPTTRVAVLGQVFHSPPGDRPGDTRGDTRGDTVDTADGSVPFIVTLPTRPSAPVPRPARPIPDVQGLDLRDAVRSLHRSGFHVQLTHRAGASFGAGTTAPAAGEMAPAGTLVRLYFDY